MRKRKFISRIVSGYYVFNSIVFVYVLDLEKHLEASNLISVSIHAYNSSSCCARQSKREPELLQQEKNKYARVCVCVSVLFEDGGRWMVLSLYYYIDSSHGLCRMGV